jgi:mannose-1-phosphate guanylyltransferase
MKVDHVLILAAGKGTRMGDIGKKLPKVLWPVFDKTLLELQVDYAKILAPNAKIYINYFNYKEIFELFIKNTDSFNDVTFIEEKSVLDIGGAIHNLAKQLQYTGNLLILNSDQFVFIKKKQIDCVLDKLLSLDSILFSYQVNSNEMYNALKIENNKLSGIIKNSVIPRNSEIETYTGMSLVNLNKLTQTSGESKFFNSVAKFNLKTEVICIKSFEYWDFGTTQRYYFSIFKLFKAIREQNPFMKFLYNSHAINKSKITPKGYNSTLGLNFSELTLELGHKEVVLAGSANFEKSSDQKITWKSVSDIIPS